MANNTPQKCTTCFVPGHDASKCTACSFCAHHGHKLNNCPFKDAGICSNCGNLKHSLSTCPHTECLVPGCKSKERTWLHPHDDASSTLSTLARASTHGTNAAVLSSNLTHRWTARPIYLDQAKRIQEPERPDTESAVYHGAAVDAIKILPSTRHSVITNYVQVSKTPEQIYVYDVVFADVPSPTSSTPATSTAPTPVATQARPIAQRGEKKRVFDALSRSYAPFSVRHDWATDYSTVWSRQPLFTLSDGSADTSHNRINDVIYTKQSGKSLTVPYVEFRYSDVLSLNDSSAALLGRTTAARSPAQLTRALNGMVMKNITQSSPNQITEVSANKFFLNKSWADITGVHVARGFFSSIRPGTSSVLLNVNATHSAFFAPILVSEYLTKMTRHADADEYGDPKSSLKGKTVRIIYERPDLGDRIDKNNEDNRKKIIFGFGLTPALQRFELGGKLWTVKEWFESQGAVIRCPRLSCVNVGLAAAPARNTSSAIDITSKLMAGMKLDDIDQEAQRHKQQSAKEKSKHSQGSKGPQGREIWIPAEFLEIVPMQPSSKILGSAHMKEMLSIALRHPAANHLSIVNEGLPLLGIGDSDVAKSLRDHLHLETGKALLRIPAELLDPPDILVREVYPDARTKKLMQRVKSITPWKASWNSTGYQLFGPVQLPNAPIKIVDFRPKDTGRTAEDIAYEYAAALDRAGMLAGPLTTLFEHTSADKPQWSRGPGYQAAVSNSLKTAYLKLGKPFSMLIILASSDAKFYGALKRCTDCLAGVRAVCVTAAKVSRDLNQSTFSSLVMKHNIMLGGYNFQPCLKGTTTPAFAEIKNDTMVIGVDVVHMGGDTPSIAALVASCDISFAHFPGSVRLQAARTEIIGKTNPRDMFVHHLRMWVEHNKKLPKRLLFFRDGVGEDQYFDVLDVEVRQIQQAFDTFLTERPAEKDGKPLYATPDRDSRLAMTVIVVGKRHNTRFFAPSDDMTYADKFGKAPKNGLNDYNLQRRGAKDIRLYKNAENGNIKPGLLVENVITYPQNGDGVQDFFLQSHAALAGTARSAHYVVLRNDVGMQLSFQKIQQLTHAFCYNYARATKGVSYAAPAYYADRLCDRAAKYMMQWLNENENKRWEPTEEEKDEDDKLLAFRWRVAQDISNDMRWKPGGRENPWSAALAMVMFYL
ncbi:hypothetical protein LTR86_006017 [Recurvomyces mirabilis]|nr:hypothetical protein LTR86_006017 [Recurvomyces mirabilis]